MKKIFIFISSLIFIGGVYIFFHTLLTSSEYSATSDQRKYFIELRSDEDISREDLFNKYFKGKENDYAFSGKDVYRVIPLYKFAYFPGKYCLIENDIAGVITARDSEFNFYSVSKNFDSFVCETISSDSHPVGYFFSILVVYLTALVMLLISKLFKNKTIYYFSKYTLISHTVIIIVVLAGIYIVGEALKSANFG